MPSSPHLSINIRKGWLDLMVANGPEVQEGHWSGRFGVSVPLTETGPLTADHISLLRQIVDHAERMLKPSEPPAFDWSANQESTRIVNAAMLEIGKTMTRWPVAGGDSDPAGID